MKTPKMICFDYGETLVHEEVFNGIKGYSKILEYVKDNPYNITAKELADIAFKLNTELGRFDPSKRHLIQTEVSDYAFEKYILESKNITLRLPYEEIANDFWDAACYGKATEGIEDFLSLIRIKNIKSCVVSNMSFSGTVLEKRIKKIIPSHNFDFIISSSDYVFRKPNKRIFNLALQKGEVSAEDTWFCGDQYLCDVEGAINAGMQPIWYTKNRFDKKKINNKVITISNWDELKKLIK